MEQYTIRHAALTDVGLKRSLNEDSIGFIEIKDGYVFVVCDGMGGHEGGEIASKSAVRAIIEYLNSNPTENASISLHQAILYANQQVFSKAQNMPELRGMGTTTVVLLIYKDEIYTAHVGDSRMYVLNDKNLIQLTKDHSVVQEMVDNGILSAEEAENHPRKNEITKALGIRDNVTPSISSKSLKAKTGDRFIICSDGLSGMVNKLQLTNALQEYISPDECTAQLIKLAKEGGGDDNISVQVIDIVESPFKESDYLIQVTKAKDKTTEISNKEKKNRNPVKIIVWVGGLLMTMLIMFGAYTLINGKKHISSTSDSTDSSVIRKDTTNNDESTSLGPNNNSIEQEVDQPKSNTNDNKKNTPPKEAKKNENKSTTTSPSKESKGPELNGNPNEIPVETGNQTDKNTKSETIKDTATNK